MNSAKIYGFVAGLVLPVAACSENTASHVPNPVLLPVYGVSSALDNAAYNARRNRVKRHVQRYHSDILQDIASDGGPYLVQAMDLARIPDQRRGLLKAELKSDPALYREIEPLVVALMVHGD